MPEISTFRLCLLRAASLVIGVGLGIHIWPTLAQPPQGVEHMRGVVRALLAAVGVLALVGFRYPIASYVQGATRPPFADQGGAVPGGPEE